MCGSFYITCNLLCGEHIRYNIYKALSSLTLHWKKTLQKLIQSVIRVRHHQDWRSFTALLPKRGVLQESFSYLQTNVRFPCSRGSLDHSELFGQRQFKRLHLGLIETEAFSVWPIKDLSRHFDVHSNIQAVRRVVNNNG